MKNNTKDRSISPLKVETNLSNIDVIIPAYNAERYLIECVKSILGQTYIYSSIIIVDDASTDNTSAIGRKLAEQYSERVKYVRHSFNMGPSAARNTGIQASTSSFLAFLDSDDIWLQNKLALQMELFAKTPAIGMVGCGVYYINEMGAIIQKCPAATFSDRKAIVNAYLIRSIVNGSASGLLIKRECFLKVGVFDETFRCAEDRDMWIRIAKEYDVENVLEPLVKIRRHPHNAHLNVRKMKIHQKKLIRKHLSNECIWIRQRARSYVYLDAAREYYGMRKFVKTFFNSLLAIIMYPKKISRDDDKYKLIIKAILPNRLFKNS